MLTSGDNLPSQADIDARARLILEAHWRTDGYCVPNAGTYPFQWLWDSCFHAVVWAHLGEGARAVAEMRHLFRTQDALGFVPHIDYEVAPDHHASLWGRRGASSITQPPMFGHALAEMARRGVDPPDDLVEAATRGLWFLLEHRARDPVSALVTIVHPWESGCDDSPRWDHWCPGGFEPRRWYRVKGALLAGIERSSGGAPIANPAFGAAPVGFNALVAFNARELAGLTGDGALRQAASVLARAVEARRVAEIGTWVDGGPAEDTSGRVRTLDALLVSLGGGPDGGDALHQAVDARHFGGACGPAGVHRDDPAFSPSSYWRGPAWPQLTYLLWCAARNTASPATPTLAAMLVRGATKSGFAEYWQPDSGEALGARPQSWTALAVVVRSSAADA